MQTTTSDPSPFTIIDSESSEAEPNGRDIEELVIVEEPGHSQ
jgi:hypothetical protein